MADLLAALDMCYCWSDGGEADREGEADGRQGDDEGDGVLTGGCKT